MEKLPVYSRMCLTRKLCSSCKVGGGTGTTDVVSDFVASASVSPSQKHCAKAHCVICVVIYVMAVVASRDCGLSVITLKYWSGFNLYILSSFHPRSVVDIAAQCSINKAHKRFSLKISAGIHHTAERTSLLLHTQLALAE